MGFAPADFTGVSASFEADDEVPAITEPQIRYINSLLEDLHRLEATDSLTTWENHLSNKGISSIEDISKDDAKKAIDWLIRKKQAAKEQAKPTPPVEGIHYYQEQVYKVQMSQKGNLYAKLLIASIGKFEYARGMVSQLSEKTLMTKEDAAAFGKLYGMCAVCGRTLTNEVSIEQGIGPICYSRLV